MRLHQNTYLIAKAITSLGYYLLRICDAIRLDKCDMPIALMSRNCDTADNASLPREGEGDPAPPSAAEGQDGG